MDHEVLFISPCRSDAGMLSNILGPTSLRLDHAATFQEAAVRLRQGSYHAILTEAQLPDADWMGVLDLTYELNPRPAVIVTHRLADDRFWAEVLNLGAYDLLAQPFETGEVQRILSNACSQVSFTKPVCAQRPVSPKPMTAAY